MGVLFNSPNCWCALTLDPRLSSLGVIVGVQVGRAEWEAADFRMIVTFVRKPLMPDVRNNNVLWVDGFAVNNVSQLKRACY